MIAQTLRETVHYYKNNKEAISVNDRCETFKYCKRNIKKEEFTFLFPDEELFTQTLLPLMAGQFSITFYINLCFLRICYLQLIWRKIRKLNALRRRYQLKQNGS